MPAIDDQIEDLHPIAPARPAAGYVGGKRLLAKRLVARIEATPHTLYAEPFVGMGGVFLRRARIPKVEVINDVSRDVTTFFRILQRHYVPFLEMLRWRFAARAEFDRLLGVDPETCTDLERAARFLYLQKVAYAGKVTGRAYGADTHNGSRFNLTRIEPVLADLHDRLANVAIEHLPWADFIRRYDKAGALFYLDPPYWGSEGVYGEGLFSAADFEALSDLLEGLQGRFILSINDRPEIRAMFARFTIEPVELSYRISGKVTPASELIISGP